MANLLTHNMILIQFDGCLGNKPVEEFSMHCPEFSWGLDTLSYMVSTGWTISNIRMTYGKSSCIKLPAEAFDGSYFSEPLKSLQREWEMLLAAPIHR